MNPLVAQLLTLGLAALFLVFALIVIILLVRSNKRDSDFSAALPGATPETEEKEGNPHNETAGEEPEFDFRSAAPTASRIEITGPGSQPYVPASDAPELSNFAPNRPTSRPTGRRAGTPGGATQSGTGRRARQAGVPAPQPRRDNL